MQKDKEAAISKVNGEKPISMYFKVFKTLCKSFPAVFSKREVKILKIGIHKDLKKRTNLSGTQIYKFLHKYCNSKAYQKAHIEGANRYDLEGNSVGVITNKEATSRFNIITDKI